jgi:hypothetical protein
MRAAILIVSFLPFLYFGGKDTLYHFRGRRVSRTEHLLHALVGLLLAIMFTSAVRGQHGFMLGALLLFVVVGGVDEYIYHRDIPGEESDLHAKEHLALLGFVVVSLATDWLQRNDWSVGQAYDQLLKATGGGL